MTEAHKRQTHKLTSTFQSPNQVNIQLGPRPKTHGFIAIFNESLHSRTPELLLQMDYRLT